MNSEANGLGGNGPDPIDDRLRAAGVRMRETAPDAAATRQALRRLHETATDGRAVAADRTPWMPYAWAAGLAAAAVIGIVAFTARSPQETIREIPADTTPATVPVAPAPTDPPTTVDDPAPAPTPPPNTDPVVAPPSTAPADPDERTVTYEFRDDDCFAMSLDAPDRRIGRAAGCIPLDAFDANHLYLTLMEEQLYRVNVVPDEFDEAGRPLLTIQTFPNWASASCGLIDAFPPENEPGTEASSLVMDLIACTGGDRPVALAATIPQEQGVAPVAFTTGSGQFPGGTQLTGPVPVTGLIGVEAYYGSPADGVRCVAVTPLPAGSSWQEMCWDTVDGAAAPPAVTAIHGSTVQLDLADEAAPTAAIIDALGLPFTGCGGADIETMITSTLDRIGSGVMFPALRCDDTSGVLRIAGVLLQNGPADGGVEVYARPDRFGEWAHGDSGTSVDAPVPYAVIPHELWSPWPGDTTAYASDRSDVSFGGTSSDPAVNAAAVTGILDEKADPEFPANATVLATWPQTGIPTLVIVQQDVGGDDSVVGAVHYVHLTGGPDDYRVADWFTSALCGRGGGPDLCV